LCGTSSVTLSIWCAWRKRPDCILFVIENQPTRRTKYFLFLTDMPILSAKPWPGGLSIRMSRKGLEKPWPFNVTDLKSV